MAAASRYNSHSIATRSPSASTRRGNRTDEIDECTRRHHAGEAFVHSRPPQRWHDDTEAPSSPSRSLSVLVCLHGHKSVGAITWASLIRHFVDPLGADLALMCSGNCTTAYGALAARASYQWIRHEPTAAAAARADDWSALLAARPNGAQSIAIARRTPESHAPGGWGLTRASNGRLRAGSGSAILETHAQLLSHLAAQDLA